MLVIFVQSYFDEKYKLPFVREKHKELGIDFCICKENKWGAEFYNVHPRKNEPVVIKHTNDAFLYTFLEPILRAHGIQTVVLTGLLTEACIDTTARSAQDRGYFVVVPEDCVASYNEKSHFFALETMRKSFVTVIPSKKLIGVWQKA